MALSQPVYLVYKSVLARVTIPAVAAVVQPLIAAGRVATCGIIDLEVLYSARSHADLVRTRLIRSQAFVSVPMLQQDFDRAVDVLEALAAAGEHRSAALPDLLIAAVAERAGLSLLHYDQDFDHIAAITGQPVQWVVPRGSL